MKSEVTGMEEADTDSSEHIGQGVPKAERQRLILDIVSAKVVETQEQLADELKAAGVPVTQATVSRDIRELRLAKSPIGDGVYRYAIAQDRAIGDPARRVKRLFRDFVTHIDWSLNLVIVKTLPGAAQGVAFAVDGLEWEDVIGTIAGDDTIMLIAKPPEAAEAVVTRLRRMMGHKEG